MMKKWILPAFCLFAVSAFWAGCSTEETLEERKAHEGLSGPGVMLDESQKNRSDKEGDGATAEAFRYKTSF